MYCSKWCNDCRNARVWLQQRGLEYTEVDIYATPGAAAYARKLADGPLVTPTFDIDGKVVLDFDEAALEEILG
jgi:glutaredoxin